MKVTVEHEEHSTDLDVQASLHELVEALITAQEAASMLAMTMVDKGIWADDEEADKKAWAWGMTKVGG